jgi:hypothetical protein
MKIIYLDQCAISSIAKAKDELWLQLYEKLRGALERQLIVCPSSQLHDEESLLSADWRNQLQAVYRELAGPYRFGSLAEIELAQWRKAICIYLGGAEPSDRLPVSRLCDEDCPGPAADPGQVRKDKEARHRRMQRVLEPARSFQAARAAESRRYIDQISQDCAAGTARAVRLVEGLEGEVIRIRPDEPSPLSVVNGFLRSEHAAAVPFLDIWSRLWATIAQHVHSQVVPRRLKPSDIYDVQALAYFGPYCDAMFVDNEFRKLALQRNVDVAGRYGVRLFSKNSREAFKAYLDELPVPAVPALLFRGDLMVSAGVSSTQWRPGTRPCAGSSFPATVSG